jgi:hypothetical protein
MEEPIEDQILETKKILEDDEQISELKVQEDTPESEDPALLMRR